MQPTSCTDIINQQLTCGPSALHLPIQLPHTKQCHSFQRRPQFFNLQGIRYRSHYRHQAVFVQPVQRQNGTTDFTYKTNSPLDYGLLALHIRSLQQPILETLCLP